MNAPGKMNLDTVPPNDEHLERVKQIRRNLDGQETKFLQDVWVKNDRLDRTPEGFEAIREILIERLGEVPVQKNRDYLEKVEILERRHKLHFPYIDGEIRFSSLNEEDAKQILDHLSTALIKEHASKVVREDNRIAFEVYLLRFVVGSEFP